MPLLQDLAIGSYFADVDDPRIERTRDHALLDIIIITICAVICGADGWVGVEEFGTSSVPGWLAFWICPMASRRTIRLAACLPILMPNNFSKAFLIGLARFDRFSQR